MVEFGRLLGGGDISDGQVLIWHLSDRLELVSRIYSLLSSVHETLFVASQPTATSPKAHLTRPRFWGALYRLSSRGRGNLEKGS